MAPPAEPALAGSPRADAAGASADAVSLTSARARGAPVRAVSSGPFVVNLCSSTTPMALAQPKDPELARFTVFVSRRLEDGRERFRLHMGYFESLEDAEEWVGVAREIYPGAWAGETPGKKLRAAQGAPASAPAAPAPARAPSRTSVPEAASANAPAELSLVPDPPPAPATAAATAAAPALIAAAVPTLAAATAASTAELSVAELEFAGPATAAPDDITLEEVAAPRAPQSPSQPSSARPEPRAAARNRDSKAASTAGLSNVREVLALLDQPHELDATREMPSVLPSGARQAGTEQSLSDTQVLQLLESRGSPPEGERAAANSGISLLKPDDTGTRRALQEAVATNAPVAFAVQLQWSVQPIDAAKVPPLAIFSAYTLYTVEGSRQGRRWYGLRLGFFTDAISAKQVAQYIRSDFKSVAVVPVSPQERSSASGEEGGASAKKPPAAKAVVRDKLPEPTSEFKLIEDEPRVPPAPSKRPPPAAAAPRDSGSKSRPGRVRAREKRSPQTLEETLEILGADQLQIDDGRKAHTRRSAAVQPLKASRKNSPFTKLLDRLSERARSR